MAGINVFSQRLFAVSVGGTGFDYTAAGGFQTVLRDLLVCGSTDALPLQVAVSIVSPINCTLLELETAALTVSSFTQWQGRIVLDPGDQIHIAATALADVSGHGYQLVLP